MAGPTSSNQTLITTEDTIKVFSSADFKFVGSDATSKLSKIKITALPTTGVMKLNGVAISANQEITVADLTAKKFTFEPAADSTTAVTFSFAVSDGYEFSTATYTNTINITAVNDAPKGTNKTLTIIEDTETAIALTDFGYSDAEGTAVAKVKITALPTNGVLKLDGVLVKLNQEISAADITGGKLKFTPTLNTNTSGTFAFAVSDGTLYSTPNTITTNITPVNDLSSGKDGTITATEDTTYTIKLADLGYSDVEGSAMTKVKITVLTDTTKGALKYGTAAVTLNQEITLADINAGKLTFVPVGNASGDALTTFKFKTTEKVGTILATDYGAESTITMKVTAVNDAPTSVNATLTTAEDTALALTVANFTFADVDAGNTLSKIKITALPTNGVLKLGTAEVKLNQEITKLQLQSTTAPLKFYPNPDATGNAVFKFAVSDGTLYSIDYTSTITITAVNDTPTATNATLTTLEDTTYVIKSTDFGYSDVDGNALSKVKITVLPDATKGVLKYGTAAVTANQEITLADINAGKLTFVPVANANGVASFEFAVSDGTSYNTDTDAKTVGDQNYKATINITAVNDIAVGANITIGTINEDTLRKFTTADFAGAFLAIDTGETLKSIVITSMPTKGTLLFGTTVANVGTEVAFADIAKLTFTPAKDGNGATYSTFGFKVSDGVTYSSTSYTATLNVSNINDAPVIAVSNNTITMNEDTIKTFAATDFSFSDVDGDTLGFVQIITLPLATAGILKKDGVAVKANDKIAVADISSGKLTFTPVANVSGANAANFSYKVYDNSSPLGVASTNTGVISLNITAVNDAPTAADTTINASEDTVIILKPGDFKYADIDNDPLAKIKLVTVPTSAQGVLKNGTTALVATKEILMADLLGDKITFTPAANVNGDITFTFQVSDGTAYGASTYTATVKVAAVNDLPTSAAVTLSATEDTVLTIDTAKFAFTDVDASSALSKVKITTLPTNGILKVNGVAVTAVGKEVLKADLDGGKLTFTPNANSNASSSFKFAVNDGTGYSTTEYVATVNITAVNDIPTGASLTLTMANSTTEKLTVADFGYSDVESITATKIKIIEIPAGGVLKSGTTTLANNAEVLLSVITAGNLTYTAPATAGTNAIKFQVSDGTAYSADTYTLTVKSEVMTNKLPTSGAITLTATEDTTLTIAASSFTFADADTGSALTKVKITTLPTSGTLKFGTAVVTLNQEILKSDIEAGKLTYIPAANASGNGVASFNYQVKDATSYSASHYTATINITAANDAPTSSNVALTTLEDTAYKFVLADFAYADLEATAMTKVKITSLPALGTLKYGTANVTANQEITVADIGNGKLTFVPATNANGTNYTTFKFAVTDGTNYSTDYTATMNVTAVNDAPTGTNTTIIGTEDTEKTFASTDFSKVFSSVDAGATLKSIMITSKPTFGTLKIGTAVVSVGQEILAADISKMKYIPEKDGNGATYATFGFRVGDGVSYSTSSFVATMDISKVNDAPTIPVAIKSVTATEDTDKVLATTDFSFSDVDSDTLGFVQIMTLPLATTGVLKKDGVAIKANEKIAVADISSGKLIFTPATNVSGTDVASFTYKVVDSANVATSTSATIGTVNISVTGVNDLPTAANVTINGTEDTVITLKAGDFKYADIDNNPFAKIKLLTIPTASQGVLKNGTTVLTATKEILVADLLAEKITFTPAANVSGDTAATFTFLVSDGTAYSLSTEPYTATIKLTAVNDAPTSTNATITMNEDAELTLTASNFAFADADTGDALAKVKITALPTNGILKLGTALVKVGQEITALQLASATAPLKFIPNANTNGTVTLKYMVMDNLKVGALYSSEYTTTINVTAINDAPTAKSVTLTTNEDTAYVVKLADFSYSDVEGTALTKVKITAIPDAAKGALKYGTAAVIANQEITLADINAGKLTFVPATNVNGKALATFKFKVTDMATTPVYSEEYTATMDVTAVNDAPTGANVTIAGTEDTVVKFTLANFGTSTDVDTGDTLKAIQIATLPTNGTIKLGTTAITAGQAILATDIAAGKLTYTPALNGNGATYTTFTFKLGDGKDFGTAYTATMNITAVNDKPTADNITLTTNEDTAKVFAIADFKYVDVDLTALSKVKITSLPTDGALTLNGTAVTKDQEIVATDISGGKLKFTPSANENGDAYSTFKFAVSDGTEYSAEYTATMNVTAVADTVSSAVTATLDDINENLTLTGTAVIDGTGNALDNTILGNTANNTLMGLAGDDTIKGGAGNDDIDGGDGNDTLAGEDGIDTLTGGAGNDKFVLSPTASTIFTITSVDIITDFKHGEDKIALSKTSFTKLTEFNGTLNPSNFQDNTLGMASDANDYIVYNTQSGSIYYDADGNGTGMAVKIAVLGTTTHPTIITYDDFILV